MTAEDISFYTEKYGDMILRLSFSYLKNLADAEDAVQDVFIKLLEKNVHFESAEHEKAWFTRVTINVCKNKLRMFWNRNTPWMTSASCRIRTNTAAIIRC